jgi:hypothetical protein
VRVIKLILEGSVEQHILRLADTKLHLDRSLQGEHIDVDDQDSDAKSHKRKRGQEGADEGVDVPEETVDTLMGMLRNEWLGSK